MFSTYSLDWINLVFPLTIYITWFSASHCFFPFYWTCWGDTGYPSEPHNCAGLRCRIPHTSSVRCVVCSPPQVRSPSFAIYTPTPSSIFPHPLSLPCSTWLFSFFSFPCNFLFNASFPTCHVTKENVIDASAFLSHLSIHCKITESWVEIKIKQDNVLSILYMSDNILRCYYCHTKHGVSQEMNLHRLRA